jgi:hypothetical protein
MNDEVTELEPGVLQGPLIEDTPKEKKHYLAPVKLPRVELITVLY